MIQSIWSSALQSHIKTSRRKSKSITLRRARLKNANKSTPSCKQRRLMTRLTHTEWIWRQWPLNLSSIMRILISLISQKAHLSKLNRTTWISQSTCQIVRIKRHRKIRWMSQWALLVYSRKWNRSPICQIRWLITCKSMTSLTSREFLWEWFQLQKTNRALILVVCNLQERPRLVSLRLRM